MLLYTDNILINYVFISFSVIISISRRTLIFQEAIAWWTITQHVLYNSDAIQLNNKGWFFYIFSKMKRDDYFIYFYYHKTDGSVNNYFHDVNSEPISFSNLLSHKKMSWYDDFIMLLCVLLYLLMRWFIIM